MTVLTRTPRLVLVGGIPGSGKSTIGAQLAQGQAVFLDKDTVAGPFVERLLVALGSTPTDRESQTYLKNARDLEYATMMELAYENLRLGNHVVCVAPFTKEFSDPAWVDTVGEHAALSKALVELVWVDVAPELTKHRIVERGQERDAWKLSNWATYVASLPRKSPSPLAQNVRNPDGRDQMLDAVKALRSRFFH